MGVSRSGVTSARRRIDEEAPSLGIPVRSAPDGYRFGPFFLNVAEARLFREGKPVALAPKPYDTLVYLVGHPHRVVSKPELIEAIWAGTFVTDDVLVQSVVEIRRALGDSAKEPAYIQTVPKRGYTFTADVQPVWAGRDHPESEARVAAEVVPLPTPASPRLAAVAPASRRKVAGFAVAALGVVAVTLAVVGLWWSNRGGSETTAAEYVAEPGTVVVLPVQTVDGSAEAEWLRQGLAELIAAELAGEPSLRLVPRHQLVSVTPPGLAGVGLSARAGLEVARKLKAEKLVSPVYQRVDDQFTLTASVIAVADGRRLAEVEVGGERRVELLAAVGTLSRRLADALRPSPRAVAASPVEVATPTHSVEAYEAFARALGGVADGGREGLARAEVALTEATRLDPQFARAYLRLALVQEARRRWGYASADPVPAITAAAQLGARLPERERLLVDGLARWLQKGDAAGAVVPWERLISLYPSWAQSAGVPALAADVLLQHRRWNDLIVLAAPHADAPAMPMADRALLNSILAHAYRRKGEFTRALAHMQRALDWWPIRAGPAFLRLKTLEGRVLLDAGERDRARVVFAEVARDPRADVVNITDAAWGAYMAGDASLARELVERALHMDARYGNAYHLRGWLQLAGRDYRSAAADFDRAFADTPKWFGSPAQGIVAGDLAALYLAGIALEKAGDATAARTHWTRVVAQASQTLRSAEFAGNPVARWQALHLIALSNVRLGRRAEVPAPLEQDETSSLVQNARLFAVMGRADDALQALAQAASLGAGEFQHVGDDPSFESLRAHPAFQRLLETFGRVDRAPSAPPAL